jgi:hypothetical protein
MAVPRDLCNFDAGPGPDHVPVRGFLALLVREIMRNGGQRSKWRAGLLIEAGLAAISLLGFALIALVLTEEPTILGH